MELTSRDRKADSSVLRMELYMARPIFFAAVRFSKFSDRCVPRVSLPTTIYPVLLVAEANIQ